MSKKNFFVFIFLITGLMLFSQTSYAFIDGILGTINATYDKAYQSFMKIKMVESIKIATQNYNESKKYYDEMRNISAHKGGIGGYVKDEIVNHIDRANQDIYWQFQYDLNSDPMDTAYVKKWVNNLDKQIQNKTDFSEEIYNLGKERDERLKDIAKESTKKNLSQVENTKLEQEKSLLMIEYLASIDKGIQYLIKTQNEQEKKAWEEERRNYTEYFKNYLKESKKIKNQDQQVKTALDILKEVPK